MSYNRVGDPLILFVENQILISLFVKMVIQHVFSYCKQA